MLQFEVFIGECPAIDRFSTSSIMICEITALSHKVIDDAMKMRIFEAESFFVSTEGSEVLCSFGGDIVKEFENDFSSFLSSDVKLEKHLLKFGHNYN